jgi:hypothetical protein
VSRSRSTADKEDEAALLEQHMANEEAVAQANLAELPLLFDATEAPVVEEPKVEAKVEAPVAEVEALEGDEESQIMAQMAHIKATVKDAQPKRTALKPLQKRLAEIQKEKDRPAVEAAKAKQDAEDIKNHGSVEAGQKARTTAENIRLQDLYEEEYGGQNYDPAGFDH